MSSAFEMLPSQFNSLLQFLNRLPGVGPKTATRYLYWILGLTKEDRKNLATILTGLENMVLSCANCHTISATNPCTICADPRRDQKILCVVAKPQEVTLLESTSEYKGRYHVLGGVLNHIDDSGPEKLHIKELLEKVANKNSPVEEIIFALSPDINGETTIGYLTRALKDSKVKLTRLARGLPVGSDIEYADPVTLTDALRRRYTA